MTDLSQTHLGHQDLVTRGDVTINSRRALFGSTALVASGIVLAACTSGASTTGTTVEQVIANVQGFLSYLGPVLPLLAAFVPGATPLVPVIETALTTATGLLSTMSSTMTVATAQDMVGQIMTSLDAALTAADQAAVLISDPTKQAAVRQVIAEARVIRGLLSTFITSATTAVMLTATARLASHVHVRVVR